MRWVFLFVFFNRFVCQEVVVRKVFNKKREFSDRFNTDVANTVARNVLSSIRCASKCSEQAQCSSYFYNLQDAYCQLNSGDITPGSLQPYLGTVYFEKIVKKMSVEVENTKVTYAEASDHCTGRGSQLVVADTWQKLNEVIDQVVASGVKEDFYVGCKKGADGVFRWLNGVALNETMWRRFEPNNGQNENCVTFYPEYLNSLLNDDLCTTKNAFICEDL